MKRDIEEFNRGLRARGSLFSVKVQPDHSRSSWVPHPYEPRLETEARCNRCTLRYAVYGPYAYCPDCGVHNSKQIFDKNLDLAERQVVLSGEVAAQDSELSRRLLTNALEDVVSSLDGYGRQAVELALRRGTGARESFSFQSLEGARDRLLDRLGIDLAAVLNADDWDFCLRSFQKRHVHAHRADVVDDGYIRRTHDRTMRPGQRLEVSSVEVTRLIGLVRILGTALFERLPGQKA